MNLEKKQFQTTLRGTPVTIEVSRLAGQANAAVIGRLGDTTVLATVVMGKKDTALDYFPLSVDYEERFYASGKILGSRFVRREGKPSDDAILSGRLIDRTIRPLFDARLRREVQITITVLTYDENNDPEEIGLLSASTALLISDIPWGGPVAGIKQEIKEIGDGKTYSSFFSGTKDFINMIEFSGKEIEKATLKKVFIDSHEEIKKLVSFQEGIAKEIGKEKADVMIPEPSDEAKNMIRTFLRGKIEDALRTRGVEQLKNDMFEYLRTQENSDEALRYGEFLFEADVDAFVHDYALKEGKRVDGRRFDEIRDLLADVKILSRMHGSGLFIRGETQVLAVATLAGPSQEQLIETMEGVTKKRFMLHYNFPKYSTGEVGRARSLGRREIGHGALASKAIEQVIPSKEEFPYTIRVVAETLSSNGSSSMATTCATTLALMDAGVPIKKPVAGIAIGLMTGEKGEYKILTDIQGPEDHYGDMDFKVTGTDEGVTAVQMDVKIGGINPEIFENAINAAEKARFQILEVMGKILNTSRKELSPYAPLIKTLSINPEKIGLVIGPGGKTINGIVAKCGGNIAIDIDEDGTVFVSGIDHAGVLKGFDEVQALTREYKVGDIVEGPIVRVLEFGAIVDLGGGQDGMVHVSELKEGFVKKVEDVVKLGDRITAKIIRADEGKIGLSMKAMKDLQIK
ncbi:MAG: polyribonucleotide nucleotidyltransferase [Parcubacteria group bacterium LiPW_41]|nr:MAG: polyribonucleotide nucleotidyltransferase [Parcubacteria group bacterium LiPW_41]